jgi:DNA-binding transcriptional LysR family regulator
VSSYILPRALREFRSRWPAVEVRINIGLCDEMRERVRRAELDAALTLDGAPGADGQATGCTRSLAPARLCFVVSRRPASEGAKLKRADLCGRTFLLPDPDGALPALLRAWFGPPSSRPRFVSAGTISGVINGLRNSDVVGVLPNYAIEEQLSSASLFELPVEESPPDVFVGLTVQREPLEASPLQEIVRQIEQSLEGLGSRRAL